MLLVFHSRIEQNLFFETKNSFSTEKAKIFLVLLPHNFSGKLLKILALISFYFFSFSWTFWQQYCCLHSAKAAHSLKHLLLISLMGSFFIHHLLQLIYTWHGNTSKDGISSLSKLKSKKVYVRSWRFPTCGSKNLILSLHTMLVNIFFSFCWLQTFLPVGRVHSFC